MKYFRIKDWDQFQHYKDRNPPWIKLYTSLLSRVDGLMLLPDSQRSHVFLLFLSAAMNNNRLPFDPLLIKQLIRATSDVNLEELHSIGLIEIIRGRKSASKTLALDASKMLVLEETETETYKAEKRREKPAPSALPSKTKEGSDWAYERWVAIHDEKPTWGPAEWKCLHTAIKRSGDSFRGRWEAYMASEEPFYLGHSPRKFLSDLDRWLKPTESGRSLTHDQYGWVKWCDHAGIGQEPDPACPLCIARAAEAS